jgi:hypothetical protein
MVIDELFKVGEEVHRVHETSSSVSTTDQPSFKKDCYQDNGVAPLAASLLRQTCHWAPDVPLPVGRG